MVPPPDMITIIKWKQDVKQKNVGDEVTEQNGESVYDVGKGKELVE